MAKSENTSLWDSVFHTDPRHTKSFSRAGGFKGTATNVLYLIHKATELWGPMGSNWGVEVVEEKLLTGAPILKGDVVIGNEIIHCVQIRLVYPGGKVPAFGQTTFVGTNKYGPYTDEEAPKKSLTDALTKAMSWLGFSGDIHMGLYDDNKYVNDMRKKFAQEEYEAATAPLGLSDEELDIAVIAIQEAGSLDELKSIYGAAYRRANEEQKHVLVAAKELRKDVLTKRLPPADDDYDSVNTTQA